MQRVKVMGFALLVAFAFAAISSTSAFAEEAGNPLILPEPTATAPLTFTASGGTAKLIGTFGAVECTKNEGKGEFTSKRLGTTTMDFTGCRLGTTPCNSEGDPSETILVTSADVHLVDILPKPEELALGLAIILLKPVKFACGILKFEVTTDNGVIGKLDGITSLVKTKTGTLLFHEINKAQEFKECDLDKEFCAGKVFQLLTNGGASSEAAESTVTLGKEAEVHY